MSGAVPATADRRETLWTLLRELDAAGNSEFPRGSDRTATRKRSTGSATWASPSTRCGGTATAY